MAIETWFVYLLYSVRTGKIHTGISKNPHARLVRHNAGRGSKATKTGRPWRIVWLEARKSRGEASRRAYEVKALSRADKILLAGLAA